MYTSEQYQTEVVELGLLRATANAFESVFTRLEALEAAASVEPWTPGDHGPPPKPEKPK